MLDRNAYRSLDPHDQSGYGKEAMINNSCQSPNDPSIEGHRLLSFSSDNVGSASEAQAQGQASFIDNNNRTLPKPTTPIFDYRYPHKSQSPLRSISQRRPYQSKQDIANFEFHSSSAPMASAAVSEPQVFTTEDPYAAPSRTSASPPPTAHRRGYQACDACRKRKVKCDLGSVDNPEDPPCARCKRERRPCRFSETRRKRKGDPDFIDGRDPQRIKLTDGDNGRENTNSRSSAASPSNWSWSSPQAPHRSQFSVYPGNESTYEQFKNGEGGNRTTNDMNANRGSAQQHSVPNQQVASLLHGHIATSHEALHLLSAAAAKSEEANRQNSQFQDGTSKSPSTGFASPSPQTVLNRSRQGLVGAASLNVPQANGVPGTRTASNSDALQDALSAWSRMKFVRAGWISAQEAMTYINYYFNHLAPLTPVVLHDYRDPSTHLRLLAEEPILAVAILSIASRHMSLSGPGAASRDFFVHDRIYQFLSSMLQRLMWAQEQFGGGFTGAGKVKVYEQKSGHIAWKGGFRTLGTIEALILLSEWHPRGLHFPPNEDDNRLLDIDYSLLDEKEGASRGTHANVPQESNYSAYIEPAWRCDRMSWTILGMAQSLAFELGLFDRFENCVSDSNVVDQTCVRRRRIRLLLSTYIAAQSGRMGFPSSLLPAQWEDMTLTDSMATAKMRAKHNQVDAMQACWSDLIRLIHNLNDEVFIWKQKRHDIVSSGNYVGVIEEVIPKVDAWMAEFNKADVQEPLRTIILLEAYSVYVYVNGLALQAGVEEITKIQPSDGQSQGRFETTSTSTSGAAIAGTGAKSQVEALYKVQIHHGKYIRATAEAARNILRLCLDRLVPDKHLKHTPARALFRITTGLLFSLKCFTFGAAESEIYETMDLVGKCVEAMRAQAVDDVHIISQIAEFAGVLAQNIRAAMRTVPLLPNLGSGTTSRDRTPAQTNEHQPLSNLAEQRQTQQSQPSAPRESQPTFEYNFEHAQATIDPLAEMASGNAADAFSFSYMPPPNWAPFMAGPEGHTAQDQSMNNSMLPDFEGMPPWVAVPLEPLMNSSNKDVHHGYGGLGPTVGNKELLEVLTNVGDQTHSQWHQMAYGGVQYEQLR